MRNDTTNQSTQPAGNVPNKTSNQDAWPRRDDVADEDGPHPSQGTPLDNAQDARRTDRQSKDIDPDSAESSVDRNDHAGDEA